MVQEEDSGGLDQGTTRGTNDHKQSDPGFILKVELPTGFVSGLDRV